MNSLSVLYYTRSSINLLSKYVKVILSFIRIEDENFRQKKLLSKILQKIFYFVIFASESLDIEIFLME